MKPAYKRRLDSHDSDSDPVPGAKRAKASELPNAGSDVITISSDSADSANRRKKNAGTPITISSGGSSRSNAITTSSDKSKVANWRKSTSNTQSSIAHEIADEKTAHHARFSTSPMERNVTPLDPCEHKIDINTLKDSFTQFNALCDINNDIDTFRKYFDVTTKIGSGAYGVVLSAKTLQPLPALNLTVAGTPLAVKYAVNEQKEVLIILRLIQCHSDKMDRTAQSKCIFPRFYAAISNCEVHGVVVTEIFDSVRAGFTMGMCEAARECVTADEKLPMCIILAQPMAANLNEFLYFIGENYAILDDDGMINFANHVLNRLLYAMHVLHTECKIIHGDAHLGNFLVDDLRPDLGEDITPDDFKYFNVVINDFGLSRCMEPTFIVNEVNDYHRIAEDINIVAMRVNSRLLQSILNEFVTKVENFADAGLSIGSNYKRLEFDFSG